MSEYYRYLKYLKYINGVPQDEYKQGDLIGVVEADSQSDCEQGVEYRWVEVPNEYYCDGYVKYAKERKQAYRNGVWENTSEYRKGLVLDLWSTDCGVEWQYRWESTGKTACNGYQLTTQEVYLVSKDMGNTWLNVEPVEYREMVTDEFSELCLDSVEPFTFIPNNQVKVDYIWMGVTKKEMVDEYEYNARYYIEYYVDWGEGRKKYEVSAGNNENSYSRITDEIPLTDHEIKIWGNIYRITSGDNYINLFENYRSPDYGTPIDITEITNWGDIFDKDRSFNLVFINGYYGTKIAKPKFDKKFYYFILYNAPNLESFPFTSLGAFIIDNCKFSTLPEISNTSQDRRYCYDFIIRNCDNLTGNISINGSARGYIKNNNIENIQLNGNIMVKIIYNGDDIAGKALYIECPKLKTVSGNINQPISNRKAFNEENNVNIQIIGPDNESVDVSNFYIDVRSLGFKSSWVKTLPHIVFDEELTLYETDVEVLNLDNIVITTNTNDNVYLYPDYNFDLSDNKRLTTITGTLKDKKNESKYTVNPTDLTLNFRDCTSLKLISPILRDWTDRLPTYSSSNNMFWILTFENCTSLLTIPNDFFGDNIKMPYNGLPYEPYEMFRGCTSLTNYPTKGGVPMWNWPLFYKDEITESFTFINCPLIASEVPIQWGGNKFQTEYPTELTVTLDSSNLTYDLGYFTTIEYGGALLIAGYVDWGDGNIELLKASDDNFSIYYNILDGFDIPTGSVLNSHTYSTSGTYKIKVEFIKDGIFCPNISTIFNKLGGKYITLNNPNNISYIDSIEMPGRTDIYLSELYYNVGHLIPSTLLVYDLRRIHLNQIPTSWLNGGLKNNYLDTFNLKIKLTNVDLTQAFINCPNITEAYIYFDSASTVSLKEAFKGLTKLRICTIDPSANITDATEAFYNSLLEDSEEYLPNISRCQKAVRTYANSRFKGSYDSSTGEYILPLGDVTTPDMTECFMNTPIEKVSINSIAEGVNLTRCFSDCQQLKEIPKVGDKYLWEIPGITGTECFKGCVKLDMSIIPDGWK